MSNDLEFKVDFIVFDHLCQSFDRQQKCFWSNEEDKLLLQLVSDQDAKWTLIAKLFNEQFQSQRPRSANALQNRYKRSLNPSLNKGVWSAQENLKLFEILRKLKVTSCSEISKLLITRSDLSVGQHIKKENIRNQLQRLGLWKSQFDKI